MTEHRNLIGHLADFLASRDSLTFESRAVSLARTPAGSLAIAIEAPELLFICHQRNIELSADMRHGLLRALLSFGEVFCENSAFFLIINQLSPCILGLPFPAVQSHANAEKKNFGELENKWRSRCVLLNIGNPALEDPTAVARNLCYKLHKCEYLSSFHLVVLLASILEAREPQEPLKLLRGFAAQARHFLINVSSAMNCPLHSWEAELLLGINGARRAAGGTS